MRACISKYNKYKFSHIIKTKKVYPHTHTSLQREWKKKSIKWRKEQKSSLYNMELVDSFWRALLLITFASSTKRCHIGNPLLWPHRRHCRAHICILYIVLLCVNNTSIYQRLSKSCVGSLDVEYKFSSCRFQQNNDMRDA